MLFQQSYIYLIVDCYQHELSIIYTLDHSIEDGRYMIEEIIEFANLHTKRKYIITHSIMISTANVPLCPCSCPVAVEF
jgi:hypothetical protein